MIGLEYIVKEFHMSFTEVGELLGVSRKSVSNWTNGWQSIPKKHIGRLSGFFGVPENYFQKELNEVEKLGVQIAKIAKEDTRREQTGELQQSASIMEMLNREVNIEQLSIRLRNEISGSDDKLDVSRRVANIFNEDNDMRFETLYMFLISMEGNFMGGNPFTAFKNEELGRDLFLLLKKHGITTGDID